MQIWAESGKSALPICNYSQILYQFLMFTQNLKRSPVSILLSIILAFLTFLLSVSGIIMGIVSFVCVIAAISAFIQHDTVTGIQELVIGFLLSLYGLQKLALYLIAFIGAINEGMKTI